ncbi:type II toxin-antitoxin system VapC family toxin [Thiocystis violacea]|uniref:type II toxin-antitoxin system VapC family toxin n=1 Tax=Thiocystis violacea TaxID=13725 RepID=UPI001903B67C|nr:type II toxin-antitoxin system VapC family toxin [Thiocystis violacea]MBK1719403.1 VapC toxin family PIN domain ribonuclease [Thiocystis violacea]
MILVDTSVWIDHLRQRDPILVDALDAGRVLMHPFVIGELACGCLANRDEVLELLARLPAAPVATDPETRRFIDRHRLMGRGIGYIDVHLLAATALSGDARLWTRDKRLTTIAVELRLAWRTTG